MMKEVIIIFILFISTTTEQLLQAQTVIKKTVKKSLTVKDLNALETEKIKAISVKQKPQEDSIVKIIKKDTTTNKTFSVIEKTKDSILKKAIPVDIITEPFVKTKPVTSKPKDTIVISKKITTTIIADANPDSLVIKKAVAIDTIFKSILPIKESKTTDAFTKLKVSDTNFSVVKDNVIQEDSAFYSKYDYKARFADSIRNANKHWLDSTLTALPKTKPVVINDDDEIEIFVSGGGLYGGVNAKIFDRLTIYHTGLVHREFKTRLQGEQIEEKKISKDELKKLAQFIVNMGFFSFNKIYDCDAKDYNCTTRMKKNPEPVPLTVSVAIGARRNKIYVTIFAPHIETNYVNYPTALEKIVDAIYAITE